MNRSAKKLTWLAISSGVLVCVAAVVASWEAILESWYLREL